VNKIEIDIKSKLVSKSPREDRKPSVFKRVLKKYVEDKLHPGKIIGLYVNLKEDYKLFGMITLNTGGSISFFPDFYQLDNFDHLTLAENNVHLTTFKKNGKHKKLYKIESDLKSNYDYHLVTFAMQDGDLLMDLLPEISLPEIYYKNKENIEIINVLQNSLFNDPIMLSFPDEEGCHYIQILVVPKGKNVNEISIVLGFEKLFGLTEPVNKIINAKKMIIQTDNDFSLCVICFKINQKLKSPFYIAFAQMN
jgi:hypothetical protein